VSSHEKPPTFKSLIRLSAIGPALLGVPILMIICAMFFREAGDYADKALAILLYTPWVGFPLFWYLLTARSRWGLRYSRQQEAALFFGALANLAVGLFWGYMIYSMFTHGWV
jgi:hypothetical protein